METIAYRNIGWLIIKNSMLLMILLKYRPNLLLLSSDFLCFSPYYVAHVGRHIARKMLTRRWKCQSDIQKEILYEK
jgi:hypothetical protein